MFNWCSYTNTPINPFNSSLFSQLSLPLIRRFAESLMSSPHHLSQDSCVSLMIFYWWDGKRALWGHRAGPDAGQALELRAAFWWVLALTWQLCKRNVTYSIRPTLARRSIKLQHEQTSRSTNTHCSSVAVPAVDSHLLEDGSPCSVSPHHHRLPLSEHHASILLAAFVFSVNNNRTDVGNHTVLSPHSDSTHWN